MVASNSPNETTEIALFPHQWDYVYSDARYLLNTGGWGSGKTWANIFRLLRLMDSYPGLYLVTGSDLPTIKHTILREWLDIVPPQFIQNYNKSDHLFTMRDGSEVLFRAFDDPRKLRSFTLTGICLTEMTNLPHELFREARGRIRESERGFIFGDTNPGAFSHWVYKEFIENPIANSHVIYSKTTDNTELPADYLEDLKSLEQTNPELYRRVVEGHWGALEGLVYALPEKARKEPPHTDFDEVIAGLDFGFSHPTGMVILGRIADDWYQVDELYERKLTSSQICDRAKIALDKWAFDCVYCDSARPEIIADLISAGIPAKPSIKGQGSVFDGIMYVKGLIGQGNLFVSPSCQYTLREFDSYIWDSKNPTKEVPLKINDDLMDALRYALHGHRIPSGVVGGGLIGG